MEKRMVIVGAGIAGLSAGCYARMNGFKTTILEMHTIPGGLCTAWKRKGYTFDISMHMLVGSRSGPFHQMWRELGALEGQEFFYHNEASRIESGGRSLTVSFDPRLLEERMLAVSPGDADLTKEFVRLLSGRSMMGAASLKPAEMCGVADWARMGIAILPLLGIFRKYGRLTVQEFADRFQDPFLRSVVRFFIDAPGWPMPQFPLAVMSGFIDGSRNSGVPLGGSQQFVFRIADFYKGLGGEILYKSRVADVIVENDRVKGVRLDDGTSHDADVVIWAADGHKLIFEILGGRYMSDKIKRMFNDWTPVQPLVHVALGVARDMSKEPHLVVFEPEKPITVAGEQRRWIPVLHHSFDPSMAPPGKSAVEVWYPTRYDYWESLAGDRPAYEAEKQKIADMTIAELDKRWPGFASQVEIVDVPTPSTYVRYTGNWQGSPDGWYITNDNMKKQTMLRSLPGLPGLHTIGQWTGPFTGTVMAALSGRQIVQLLCKEYKMPFVASRT
jgi:phytoene dehydrogenase-like protein